MSSREEVIAKASQACVARGYGIGRPYLTMLYDSGLLMTPEAERCVEACEDAERRYPESKGITGDSIFDFCRSAGRASLAAKPAPRYATEKCAGTTFVHDTKGGCMAAFHGPGNVDYAEAHAARLNESAR